MSGSIYAFLRFINLPNYSGFSAEPDGAINRDRNSIARGRGRGGRGAPMNSSNRFGDRFSAERSAPTPLARGGRGGSRGRGDRGERNERTERVPERTDRGERSDRDNGKLHLRNIAPFQTLSDFCDFLC